MIWDKVTCISGDDENVYKYVFEKSTGAVESVLYKYPTFNDRTVVCCSTQSGCPVGCRFCGAGDSFVRSLIADEIVSQTKYLFADKNIQADQIKKFAIMFMSMGEPLLNLKEVVPAIRQLNQLYSNAALLISTSAPRVNYQPVIDISKEIDKVGLQFSVHESTDERRNALIPFKQKLSLKEIAVEGERWFNEVGRRPFFNYCAHNNNSTTEDADRVKQLFNPAIWEATISVVCERDETVTAATERQRSLAEGFQSLLLERGFNTRVFDPAGQSHGGGCGQLFRFQEWVKKNTELVKPTIGKHLPVVHSPQ